MNPSPNRAAYLGSNSNTSTLRPRNARLISYADEDVDLSDDAHATTSSRHTGSVSVSRRTSRSPEPVRAKSIGTSHDAYSLQKHGRSTSSPTKVANGGLWDSWSSLHGVASSLLGTNVQPGGTIGNNKLFKQPAWMAQSSSKSQLKWGPPSRSATPPNVDSAERRKAMLEAKKREAMLLACAAEGQDVTGRFKRKTSNGSLTPFDAVREDQDALVYLHHVQPQDTLAGVMIKYNCLPDVFRKVNRFWPNDNIQTRTHVFLPVEACSIRGRKVEGPISSVDLLSSELANLSTGQNTGIKASGRQSIPVSQATSPAPASTPSGLESTDYEHDSWVSLPSFSTSTQILRIPRRTLGYFPRARRKSNTDTFSHASITSTPKTSFDMLRHPPTHAAQQAAASASYDASPVRRSRLPSQLRQRTSSTAATPTAQSFADLLHGPGSIGSLSGLRTEPAVPGAPVDPLNKNFSHYLPDLAAPEDFPRSSLRPPISVRATPRPSTDSTRSNNSSSNPAQALGETMERWVRKMASPRDRGVTKPANLARMGDLIELENTSDFGSVVGAEDEPEHSQEPERERGGESWEEEGETTPRPPDVAEFGVTAGSTVPGISETEEALLNQHFPVRGRVRTAYDRTRKGP